MKEVKVGVYLGTQWGYGVVKDLAQECEQLGYQSAWLSDHFMDRGPQLECWTTLTALSSATEKLRIGTLVLCNSFRNPSVVAKMAATLDVISGGRLEFGIGAGWYEREYLAYGIDFPRLGVRVRQLREGLEIIKRMWSEEKASYEGKYFRIKEAVCDPKPVQRPHPPITIGGTSEKLMLRVIGEYADRSNWWGTTIEEFKHRLEVLRSHCTSVGRDYEKIEKSCVAFVNIQKTEQELVENLKPFYSRQKRDVAFEEWLAETRMHGITGTPDQCLKRMQEYMNLGVTYFILSFRDLPNKTGMRFFAKEILQKVR